MTGPFTVTFKHGGKSPKAGEYESTITITGPKTGTFRGSIFPDDMQVKGRIKDGRYPLHIGFHRRDKQPKPTIADLCVRTSGFRAALIVNLDKAVPVISDNPAKTTSTYIHVHNGGKQKRGSEGCQTMPADDWAKFIQLFLDHYPRLEDWMAVSQYIGVQCGELVVSW